MGALEAAAAEHELSAEPSNVLNGSEIIVVTGRSALEPLLLQDSDWSESGRRVFRVQHLGLESDCSATFGFR
jgi:hypothetical protein